MGTALDLGLLLLRLLLGGVLAAHGMQKLAGWFHGPGPEKAAVLFESLGQHPGRTMARLAASCELGAAGLLVLGAAAPLGAAVAAGTMLVAGTAATLKAGRVWAAAGGGELAYVLAAAAAALAFTGPGAWSVDEIVGTPWHPAGVEVGVVAVVVALVAAAGPILRTGRALRPAAHRD